MAARDDSWPIGSHGLTLLREPLNDPRWRDALHRLFVEFAESVDAVLATAEVLRRWSWSRSGLSVTPGRSELGNYLAARGEWSGLLPYPTWWT